jgi:dimethylhistidine N-methyltransferase
MPRRLSDQAPDVAATAAEVLTGLRESPKRLPCKLFYDERGSQLFEEITRLPEYYPTRAELSILETRASEMAAHLGPRCLLVEFGSGSSLKTRILLDELVEPAGYVPIDISKEHLLESAAELAAAYPTLEVLPVCADYMTEVEIPATKIAPARRTVFFPGGTIGNFHRQEAVDFLARKADLVGAGGGLLIGVDLDKDPEVLNQAYNDSQGVTAEFNQNVLVRLNRELGADFRIDRFRHRAFYDRVAHRIEMHLDCLEDHVVHVADEEIAIRKGESIWTESSYKYSIPDFQDVAVQAGCVPSKLWTDDRDLFSIHFLTSEV